MEQSPAPRSAEINLPDKANEPLKCQAPPAHIGKRGRYDKSQVVCLAFFLGCLFLIAIFGWLPYFVKIITEGITVIFKKFLG